MKYRGTNILCLQGKINNILLYTGSRVVVRKVVATALPNEPHRNASG